MAIVLLDDFEKLMKRSTVQEEFEVFDKLIDGTRVQNRRMQLLHKQSRIVCWIQFGLDFDLAESNQTIRDCINHSPLCKWIFWNSFHSMLKYH